MVCLECIQLVTEDAVIKRQQEWSDVKLQYLLQLRHSIVMCVCIHMMRDEESSESHDKVPTLLTLPAALSLSHNYQRLSELFEELSVVSDQVHSLDPLIELDKVETVRE